MAVTGLVDMLGEELQGKAGLVKTSEALCGKTNVMIYFSAHWCPPCRGFTPQLVKAYEKGAQEKNIEVVFVSSDRDEAGFSDYYGEMPWLALPFGAKDKKSELAQKFGVRGIPMLVILDADGNLVTGEGRGQYAKYFGTAGGGGCNIL
eukprot:TRINITY_DN81393_c0_g1_i1.p1 TRINITY_DN81393_c0_g1~~TRINITY_DN81393_c0_g1_i1.p1  ORF type:complete len:148 (-),score=33.04 TRINITY_DN81393_c0_g1_i1:175-618(-)